MVERDVDSMKTDYNENEYCVTTFPQPETEELQRDGHAECMCTGWFKRKVMSTPGFPSPIVHPPRITFAVRETKGRGFGMFATEDIEAGDLIVAERPLVVKMIWNLSGVRDESLNQEQQLRGVRGCASYADTWWLTGADVCGHGKEPRAGLLAHVAGDPEKVYVALQQPSDGWLWAPYWHRPHERI